MNGYLIGAAAVSLLTFGVHFFLGSPEIARPLLQSNDIKPVAKYTNYYCWHMVSLVLVAMAAGFALGAIEPQGAVEPVLWSQTILWTGLSGSFAIWNLALIMWKRQKLFEMPQWILFIPITILGILGHSL